MFSECNDREMNSVEDNVSVLKLLGPGPVLIAPQGFGPEAKTRGGINRTPRV